MGGGNTAELLAQLENLGTVPEATPLVTAMVMDGATIAQMLVPGTSETFSDYINCVFLPYIMSQLDKVTRMDVVWDVYCPDSLKAATQEKRGTGTRKRVQPTSSIPTNWQSFLGVDDNKSELFKLLAEKNYHPWREQTSKY